MKFLSVFALILSYAAFALAKDDAKECEVCVKVIDDVRSTMTKAEIKDKSKVEGAIGKYCANEEGKLTAREKKICYYIDPIKRDVAQPFSLGMPALTSPRISL